MAWLQKRGNIYWIGWRLDGKQYRESTKLTTEPEARERLKEIEDLERARARDALTSDYFAAVTGKKVERVTASKFLCGWLAESEPEVTRGTMLKYRQVVREFSEHIEADSKGVMLENVTVDQVAGFLAGKRAHLSSGTIKGYRRILSSIFLLAQNRGLIKANPVALTKARGKAATDTTTRKRPFTIGALPEHCFKHGLPPSWRL